MTPEESAAWHPEIFGWSVDILPFYEREAKVLPYAARVVEVGVHQGRSLLYLAERLTLRRAGDRLWGIDTTIAPELTENIARFPAEVGRLLSVLHDSSVNASREFANETIDLVFLDGAHGDGSVRDDIVAWWPKLAPWGLLAGHDYSGIYGDHPGVNAAVDAAFGKQAKIETSVWSVRKGIAKCALL